VIWRQIDIDEVESLVVCRIGKGENTYGNGCFVDPKKKRDLMNGEL
jgi:hypothetical protein